MTGRAAPSALLLVLGVVVVQLVRTGSHLRYVKPWLGSPLLVSGLALALVGAAGVFAAYRSARPQGPAPSQVGWLLAVPIGLILLVDPPALGSYGLQGRTTVVQAPQGTLGSLPPARNGAVELTLREYARRAAFEPAGLEQAQLRLVGFAVPATPEERARHGSGFYLTRIALNCCAADGQAVRVFIASPTTPPADTWWQVEGRGQATPGVNDDQRSQADATLTASRLTAIGEPANPYSY
ncbi:MAG TPA: TIGR03943 family protein [Mycobacteriales bacterium]|nr:TIGR03943 family protein [Mycobacteriales bacterium]